MKYCLIGGDTSGDNPGVLLSGLEPQRPLGARGRGAAATPLPAELPADQRTDLPRIPQGGIINDV
jgi:hypothetical protein